MSTLGNDLMEIYWKQNLIPTDGLVFYHPLDSLMLTTPTGQTMTYAPELTSERVVSVGGVPCVNLTGEITTSTYSMTSDLLDMQNKSPITLSVWVNPSNASLNTDSLFDVERHPYSARMLKMVNTSPNIKAICSCNNDTNANSPNGSVYANAWNHILGTVDAAFNSAIYINGVLQATAYATETSRKNDYEKYATIGCYGRENQGTYKWLNAYISCARIYSRVLTQSEITALANEFTPTQY